MNAEPRLNHVQCLGARGLRRMAYWEWGDPANPRVLVCVHGLARQARDFDTLAQAMSAEYRVVCADVVGRGQSDWLADPSGYQIPAYVADMVTLLARLNAQTVHWVGTSMGGLIGLGLASLPQSPISKLVLNDVGPTIQFEALLRIGNYLGQPLRWSTVDEAADYLHTISASFGPHTRAQWLALSRPMLKADGDGFKLHYDPLIAQPFKAGSTRRLPPSRAAQWTRGITCSKTRHIPPPPSARTSGITPTPGSRPPTPPPGFANINSGPPSPALTTSGATGTCSAPASRRRSNAPPLPGYSNDTACASILTGTPAGTWISRSSSTHRPFLPPVSPRECKMRNAPVRLSDQVKLCPSPRRSGL